jgi:unsaturated rhamnogalacturonyl hydrolase
MSDLTSLSPMEIGRIIIEDLLSRPDYMLYEVGDVRSLHYAEACAGFGALRLAGQLKDDELVSRLKARYSVELVNTANHVDANVYGIVPLEIYLQTKEEEYLKRGMELADGQWLDPLPNGMTRQTRFWIDDIYMIASLQVQAFKASGLCEYLERAALEIDAYLERLQQPNGLFHHGESAPFFWGRGNGWVAAGLAMLLVHLPASNQHYKNILQGYEKMMKALMSHQCGDGMWRQLVDREESWKEGSATAMFGYAICLGVKEGILPKGEFFGSCEKAFAALTGYMSRDGKLRDICAGMGQSAELGYYLERPKVAGDLHGQAAMLWFCHSLLADTR